MGKKDKPPDATDFLSRNNLVPIAVAVLIGGAALIKASPFASVDQYAALEQREKSDSAALALQLEALQTQVNTRFTNSLATSKETESELDRNTDELRTMIENAQKDMSELRGEFEQSQRKK